jgi:hypothetical protein
MAFFNYVNPWPGATHWPLRCSAPGDGMPPCGRADFVPEISCAATCYMLHLGLSCDTIDRLPAPFGPLAFSAGRSGCRCALFRVRYGLVLYGLNHAQSAEAVRLRPRDSKQLQQPTATRHGPRAAARPGWHVARNAQSGIWDLGRLEATHHHHHRQWLWLPAASGTMPPPLATGGTRAPAPVS